MQISVTKIPVEDYKPSYYCQIWLTIADGGSDQWLYVVRDGLTYIFLEIIDLPAYCGSDADYRWCASVATVDLQAASLDTVASAIQCCGAEDQELDFKKEPDRLAIAEMMFSYGAKSPLFEESAGPVTFDSYGNCEQDYTEGGTFFRSLRAKARRFAEEFLFEEGSRNDMLDSKVVNKMGQTARQYAMGTNGLWNNLRYIKELGDNASNDQKLILKIYAGCHQTLGAGPIPDDLQGKF